MPVRSLSDDRQAIVRSLLPLPLVPARNRHRVCAERDDRSHPHRRASWRGRSDRHSVAQRQRPEDLALPDMPHCGLEQLRRRRRHPLRARRHAGRTRPASSRHSHLHRVETAVGRSAGWHTCGRGVLQGVGAVAEGKSRAPLGAAGAPEGALALMSQ